MLAHKVRGVAVMTSEISLRLIQELARRRIAVTFLDLAPVRQYVSNLRIDYYSGIQQIVSYLYNHGHRRIAFVAGGARLESKAGRVQAEAEYMLALAVVARPSLPRGFCLYRGRDA